MRTIYRRAVLLGVLNCLLFSCAHSNKAAVQKSIARSTQHLEAGDFQEAIDSYKLGFARYPREDNLMASFAATTEKIKRVADLALEKKDHAQAEKNYSLLLRNFPSFKRFERSLSFNEASLREIIRKCQTGSVEKQARQAFTSGDTQKALDIYKASLRTRPDDPDLNADYLNTLEKIVSLGKNALEKQDYASAGKTYSVLLKNFSSFKRVESQLSVTRKSLDNVIATCRINLTQQGLEQYRKGNLSGAISIWESILVFDPENADIKKSIETAKNQLKKLRQITST